MQLILLSDLHHCLGCQTADEKFIHLQAWEQSPTSQTIWAGGGSVLNESPNCLQCIGTAEQATLRNMHFTQQLLSFSFLIGTSPFSNKAPSFMPCQRRHMMSCSIQWEAASLTAELCDIPFIACCVTAASCQDKPSHNASAQVDREMLLSEAAVRTGFLYFLFRRLSSLKAAQVLQIHLGRPHTDWYILLMSSAMAQNCLKYNCGHYHSTTHNSDSFSARGDAFCWGLSWQDVAVIWLTKPILTHLPLTPICIISCFFRQLVHQTGVI